MKGTMTNQVPSHMEDPMKQDHRHGLFQLPKALAQMAILGLAFGCVLFLGGGCVKRMKLKDKAFVICGTTKEHTIILPPPILTHSSMCQC